MSETYGAGDATVPGNPVTGDGKVQTTKQEFVAVEEVAKDAAGDVVATAKDEAGSVADEAKVQVHDLYLQTRDELSEQAGRQQERIAFEFHSAADELDSMARNSDGTGVASDLVRRASRRLSGAASWLDAREPAEVLEAAKMFARKRPVAFIVGAVVIGAVVGRLTRALASSAAESSGSNRISPRNPHAAVPVTSPADGMSAVDDAGLYTELSAQYEYRRGDSDERPDAF